MDRSKISRIIPIALTLVIAAVIIAAFISLIRFVFFSGPTTSNSTTDIGNSSLINTSADRAVSLTVRGPIVADESFRSYQIKVSPTGRSLVVYKGYIEEPIKTITLTNNTKAYEQFVYALDKANMMKGVEVKNNNDLRGVCAPGSIHEYQTLKSDVVQKGLWTSSCSGSRGTLNASSVQLNSLFVAQIPGSRDIINNIW